MRLIDADALEYHKQLECMGNGQYEDIKVVYECDIDNAPTIQQELVRKEGDNMRKKYTYILESMDEIKLAISRLEQDVADIWKSIKSDNYEKA